MWLSDMIRQDNISAKTKREQSLQAAKADNHITYKMNQHIRQMTPGQTVLGEIVSKNGGQVEIKLSDDVTITARLEADVNLDPGKVLAFEVKSNNGATIAISPLFENLNTSANVVKALSMAGLPINQNSARMVESMMKEGMGIDRKSLQEMYRNVFSMPDTKPETIVQMKNLSLPITAENVSAFENYKTANHHMMKGLSEISDKIPTEYAALKENTGVETATSFMDRVIFSMIDELETGAKEGSKVAPEVLPQQIVEHSSEPIDNGIAESTSNVKEVETNPPGQLISDGTVTTQSGAPILNSDRIVSNMDEAWSSGNSIPTQISTDSLPLVNKEHSLHNFEQKEWKQLEASFIDAGISDESIQDYKSGNISSSEFLKEIMKHLKPQEPQLKDSIYLNKEFMNLIKDTWSGENTIKPIDVEHKEAVTKLYEKIYKQLNELTKVLESVSQKDSELGKSVAEMKNNIDFMNQLSQVANYIQLPLKMLSSDTHGELYVYTNKRNMASQDGSVSALLHLDMENLGPVDVYVAMKDQKVNTKFYVADEELLDFIYSNIYILTERLEKRGYQMKCDMIVRGESTEENPVFEEILRQDKNISSLTQYSFDARA